MLYRYIQIQNVPAKVSWIGFEDSLSQVRTWDDLKDVLTGISVDRMQEANYSWRELQNGIVTCALQGNAVDSFPHPLEGLSGVVQVLLEKHGPQRALQIFLDLGELEKDLDQRRQVYFLEKRRHRGIVERIKEYFTGRAYDKNKECEEIENSYRSYVLALEDLKRIKEMMHPKSW